MEQDELPIKGNSKKPILVKEEDVYDRVGVMGCAALLVLGFGIAESVKDVETLQFKNILKYDISVLYDRDLDQDSFEEYKKSLDRKKFRLHRNSTKNFSL